MIKKQKIKLEKLLENPYILYVTNAGFIGTVPTEPNPKDVNHKS